MNTERRAFLRRLGVAAGAFYSVRGAFAQQLVLTPAQTIGPYYPDRMPLDQDNDLILLNDNITPAIGEVTWVSGKVLDNRGQAVRNALVEIWQADNNGAYIHSRSPIANRDGNFQGYGKFLTGSNGGYVFRTVKPGLYPGRTRHIHYQITMPDGQKMTTQLYVQGDPLNASDGVLNGIRDAAQKASVIRPFTAIPDSRTGELTATFDIVMGYTPADPPAGVPSVLSQYGVVNGAGYQPGVTPGAWLSIFGDNLASTSRPWASGEIVNGDLPTSLDDVSVSINGKPAVVYYISPNQINVQAPSDDTTGDVSVVVTNRNGSSTPVKATLQRALPGFFLFPNYYVAATHSDGSLVGPAGLFTQGSSTPAKPGEQISLYGTGFGPTSTVVPSGRLFAGAATLVSSVSVRVGSSYADVSFAGLSGAGLNQINITVPNVADGDHDVRATIDGVRTQPLARLRVQR